jgi:hypothetical protein
MAMNSSPGFASPAEFGREPPGGFTRYHSAGVGEHDAHVKYGLQALPLLCEFGSSMRASTALTHLSNL